MSTGAAAAAAQAAIANATKASGAIVRIDKPDFVAILARQPEPLVLHTWGGFFSKTHRYLTSYKGFVFFTQSDAPLALPAGAELIEAQKFWIPD